MEVDGLPRPKPLDLAAAPSDVDGGERGVTVRVWTGDLNHIYTIT